MENAVHSQRNLVLKLRPAAVSIEVDLVARAEHDPDAFAELYRLNSPAIRRAIRRRVGDGAVVDELVSETFLTALRYLPRYRQRGLPFRAWLYRLANTSVSRWVRREGRTRSRSLAFEPVDASATDDVEFQRAEARAALLRLPARLQAVLSLHYLEELPLDQVARILGCRVGTVKSRLAKGRGAYRQVLERMNWSEA